MKAEELMSPEDRVEKVKRNILSLEASMVEHWDNNEINQWEYCEKKWIRAKEVLKDLQDDCRFTKNYLL